ncbi:unnamed protein product [Echinostoma caproni]|uniref:RRM domain-containing protein n=1 Tax=Echinostoma caproni TaxID=27848 RepID=A0A3P8L5E8_9TREM|nr:unnamed protein product [Echinostoma caproni]
MFGHVGVLEEFVMYPPDDREEPASKVAFVRYLEPINSEVALHLNNTVFLDRALIVLPLANGLDSIPDEKYADLVRAPPHTAAGVLPRTADWPLDVISMVVGRPGEQVIQTIEPRLSSLAFPLYPPLPATTDGSRIEEIRRTILVTNLDPKTTGDQVCTIPLPGTEVFMWDIAHRRKRSCNFELVMDLSSTLFRVTIAGLSTVVSDSIKYSLEI